MSTGQRQSAEMVPGDYFVTPLPESVTQFASREQVSGFLDGAPLDADPLWGDFGFDTVADYAFWAPRLCGVVCVKMVTDAVSADSRAASLAGFTSRAVELGGYRVRDADGAFIDKGWFYAPLLELARERGLDGAVFTSHGVAELCAEVRANHYVIASVHPGVIRGDLERRPDGKSGGHLVVVHGFRQGPSGCEGMYVHNPSGRTRATQDNCFVPLAQFEEAYARRGLTLWHAECGATRPPG